MWTPPEVLAGKGCSTLEPQPQEGLLILSKTAPAVTALLAVTNYLTNAM